MTVLTSVVPEFGVRQVYNGTGGALLQGSFVKLSGATKNQIVAAPDNDDPVLGVLMQDVADGTYGECQIEGVAKTLAGGTIAVGARVMPTTAAVGLTCTLGHAVIGVAVTAGSSGALFEMELTGPGGVEMPG
jgi:hypothetical protein